jgi:hypothetical protein
MEFFIPSLFIFLLAIAISFAIIPRFTPLVIAVLSVLLLTYGVYDHYKMFAYEYRLSTWQNSLKIYAPALMIIALIFFIIYSILAFFTRGSVPVPGIPEVVLPPSNTATNMVTGAINTATTGLTNMLNNITKNTSTNQKTGNNQGQNEKKNNNGLSRSFLEII